jgi:ribonuclease-3
VFEALVGAIYLDLGLIHAKNFVLNIFEDPEMVDMGCLMIDDNHKDRLMRYCQSTKIELPQYIIESHVNGIFKILAMVNGTMTGFGIGKNKKQAEQLAAQNALKKFT